MQSFQGVEKINIWARPQKNKAVRYWRQYNFKVKISTGWIQRVAKLQAMKNTRFPSSYLHL